MNLKIGSPCGTPDGPGLVLQRGIFGFAPPVAKKFESGLLFCERFEIQP